MDEHDIVSMLEDLCNIEDCTDWEANFIDSIDKQYTEKKFLTDKQIAMALKIQEKYSQ